MFILKYYFINRVIITSIAEERKDYFGFEILCHFNKITLKTVAEKKNFYIFICVALCFAQKNLKLPIDLKKLCKLFYVKI